MKTTSYRCTALSLKETPYASNSCFSVTWLSMFQSQSGTLRRRPSEEQRQGISSPALASRVLLEPEVRNIARAGIKLERELATLSSPHFLRLPHIGVGIGTERLCELR